MKNGRIYYIGQGIWDDNYWQCSRPFHLNSNDLLSNTIDSSWTCIIIANGLTIVEARLIESYLISLYDGDLSSIGSFVWDGKSLINKHREYRYRGLEFEKMYNKYLNLEDGNNFWETFRRQINGY